MIHYPLQLYYSFYLSKVWMQEGPVNLFTIMYLELFFLVHLSQLRGNNIILYKTT